MREIARLCVEVSCIDDDVGFGRSVLLDPLHRLDRLDTFLSYFSGLVIYFLVGIYQVLITNCVQDQGT